MIGSFLSGNFGGRGGFLRMKPTPSTDVRGIPGEYHTCVRMKLSFSLSLSPGTGGFMRMNPDAP